MTAKAAAQPPKGTPLWDQYQALKRQHPDTILFLRLGDFYETFGDDAKLVARELQITLTWRPMGAGVRVPMAGVPHHSVDTYLARLLARGHRVALAEQLGDEPQRPVRREKPPIRRADPDPQPIKPETRASISATQLSLPL